MPLPLEQSTNVGIVRRAKALGVPLLPIIAFAAVVFLASSLQNRLGAPRESQAAQPSSEQTPIGADGWLFANSASSADATVEVSRTSVEASGKPGTKNPTATTVTTYTVMGKF
jgi:hypothetical protein